MNTEPKSTESPESAVPAEEALLEATSGTQDEVPGSEAASAPEAAPQGAAEPEPQEALTGEELAARLDQARNEAETLRDQLLRARAEVENLRRRHANELEKAHKFALDGFVRELLQVRDSLELGHDAARDDNADIAKLREGTELTLKLLGDVMERFGVAPLDPIDQPFDPEYHQAMSMQPRSDVPPNTVVAVIQKGYTLNGRLVRPALVLVSQPGS